MYVETKYVSQTIELPSREFLVIGIWLVPVPDSKISVWVRDCEGGKWYSSGVYMCGLLLLFIFEGKGTYCVHCR